MIKYRITKYNPTLRNESGEYTLDEWTSYHDIGKQFYNGILTKEEYLKKEYDYIQTIELLLKDSGVSLMRVAQLEKSMHYNMYNLLTENEKDFIENIKTDMLIVRRDIKKLCKMILREFIWARLESVNELLSIEFGYDYYMYVFCEGISEQTKEKILEKGLFVEDKGTVLLS